MRERELSVKRRKERRREEKEKGERREEDEGSMKKGKAHGFTTIFIIITKSSIFHQFHHPLHEPKVNS